MDATFPTFRFMSPEAMRVQFDASGGACDCCGKVTGWRYNGVIYGDAPDEHSVCPWCIADGSVAAKWDAAFNIVDDWSPCDPDAQKEAEQRTPGFPTWQDWFIPVCCGMPTEFLGDAGWEDLSGRWSGAVESMLEDCSPLTHEGEREEFLRTIKPGENPSAYVFRCVVCAKLVGRWDCL